MAWECEGTALGTHLEDGGNRLLRGAAHVLPVHGQDLVALRQPPVQLCGSALHDGGDEHPIPSPAGHKAIRAFPPERRGFQPPPVFPSFSLLKSNCIHWVPRVRSLGTRVT